MNNCHYIPYLYFSIFRTKTLTLPCVHLISGVYTKLRIDWKVYRPSLHPSQYSRFYMWIILNHAYWAHTIMISHTTLLIKSCFDIMALSFTVRSKRSSPIKPITTYIIENVTEQTIPNIFQRDSFGGSYREPWELNPKKRVSYGILAYPFHSTFFFLLL